MKTARVIFQTKEGKAVVAAVEKGKVKLYTDDKKAIYKALEADLKSPNYFDRQAALCMLETLNNLGLEELKPLLVTRLAADSIICCQSLTCGDF